MLEYAEAVKDGDLLGELFDDDMQLHSSIYSSNSRVLNPFRSNITSLSNPNSSPCSDPSLNFLSSPSARAVTKKDLVQQEQMHQTRNESPTERASTPGKTVTNKSSRGGFYNSYLSVVSRTVSNGSRPGLAKRDPSSNSIMRTSLRGVQQSTAVARHQQSTLTANFQQERIYKKPMFVKPFELVEALEPKLPASSSNSRFNDELRRLRLMKCVHRRPKIHRAVLPQLEAILPHSGESKMLEQPVVSDIKSLGLGMLAVTDDEALCSFCIFECIFGSSNKEVLLPASASYQRCLNCDHSEYFIEGDWAANPSRNSTSISTLEQRTNISLRVLAEHKYQVLIKSSSGIIFYLDVKASEKVIDVKTRISQYTGIRWDSHHLYSRGAILRDQHLLSAYQIGPRSLIEVIGLKYIGGHDVTQFWGPDFCTNCPWTQVDVTLAKICLPCVSIKLAIVRHSRHGDWVPFFNLAYGVDNDNCAVNKAQGNCMVCTKLARTKCAGCPLVICVNCSTHLDATCKGALNLLIYSMSREHIRNDAFLLRSDGGGF